MSDTQPNTIIDPEIAEFIFLASHGLRSPITAIRWGLEMLEKGGIGDTTTEQKEVITEVRRHAHEMSLMLRSMIFVNRIQEGHYTPKIERINLCKLVEESMAEYEPWSSMRSIPCNIHCDSSAEIEADISILYNIVQHLCAACIESAQEAVSIGISVCTNNALEVRFEGAFLLPALKSNKNYRVVAGTPGLLLYLAQRLAVCMRWNIETVELEEGHISSIVLSTHSHNKKHIS